MINLPTAQIESMTNEQLRDHGTMSLPEDFDQLEYELNQKRSKT